MIRSLNEVERICQKAAEGAGAPAGLDGDAAHGAAWLLARNLPALADLVEDLTRFPDLAVACRFERGSFGGCDQVVDAADKAGAVIAPMLVDLLVARAAQDGEPSRLRISGLTAPLFLLPPAVGYADQGWSFHLLLSNGEKPRVAFRVVAGGAVNVLSSSDRGMSDMFMAGTEWSLDAVCAHPPDLLNSQRRTDLPVIADAERLAAAARRSLAEGVSPDSESWGRLQTLAAKVLVPATEQSHRKGAGALASDNE